MSKNIQRAFGDWWHGKIHNRLNPSGSPKCTWRESTEELRAKRMALKGWTAACEYLSKEINALSEQNDFMNKELLKTKSHPTCKTCVHRLSQCCRKLEVNIHVDAFYCKDHKAEEVGEL